jgi:hypothetical protein
MSWVFQESDPMGGAAGEAYANTLKSLGMQHVLAREAIQNSVDAGIEGENSRRLDGAYSWCGNASSLDRKRGSVDSTSLPRLFARRVKVARRNGARSALALWQQHHGVTSSTLGKLRRKRRASRVSSGTPSTAAWAPMKKSDSTPSLLPPRLR